MTFTTRKIASIAIPELTPPCPLYFVSDLHMGDGSGADDFAGLHEDAFWWWLRHISQDGHGQLIMLGDLRELWQCKQWAVGHRYRLMEARLAEMTARRIRGNHDSADRAEKRFWWPNEQTPLVLGEHGHYADLWNSEYSWVGRWATWLAGGLERLGWHGVEDIAWRKLLPSPASMRPFSSEAMQATGHLGYYAHRVAEKFGVKLFVAGHTHGALLAPRGQGGAYLNVGCWVSPAYAGSYGMVYQGEVSLWMVEEVA